MSEATAEAFEDGWFHTGDLARLDTEGLLYFVARLNERLRVKGEMVSAFEIEEVVATHPAVEDCAALGVPDGQGEERVRVFVTLKPGRSLDLATLQAHCRDRASRFLVPAELVVLDDMPRTPSCKPAKGELRKLNPA